MATPSKKQVLADFLLEWMEVRYPSQPLEGPVIYVSVQSQRIYLVVNGNLMAEYPVSTARNGLGSLRNSQRTPEGLHRVARKYGDDVPPFGILKYRQYTGKVALPNSSDEDLITSRILWLDGLEPGVNEGGDVDSMERCIYIHGTADEASIGTPGSQGCIRMLNKDVIDLYNRAPLGTLVIILDN